MGTKNEPGDFDCYANAKDDEPMFVLLARDFLAPGVVVEWAERYEKRSGNPDREKIAEAIACADSMRNWHRMHYCKSCGHRGDQHGPTRGCESGMIYGRCDCYGFVPDLDRPIAPPETGEWLLLLVCCGRPDGYHVVQTEDELSAFTIAYCQGSGHVRSVIGTKLTQPVRVGFHEMNDPDIAAARPTQH